MAKKRVRPRETYVPSEADEQTTLFEWVSYTNRKGEYPELDLLYAIPNGGWRNKVTAARLKAQGVRAGVSDLHLPVPRGEYHSLWIELKRVEGGKISKAQREWLDIMNHLGHKAIVCKGWMEAAKALLEYMELPINRELG